MNKKFFFTLLILFLSLIAIFYTNYLINSQKFKVDSFAIKCPNKKYLCLDKYSNYIKIICNRDNIDTWEKFKIHFIGTNKIQLEGYDGSYIGVSNDLLKKYINGGYSKDKPNTIFEVKLVNDKEVNVYDFLGRKINIDCEDFLVADEDNSFNNTFELKKIFNAGKIKMNSYNLFILIISCISIFLSIILFQIKISRYYALILLVFGSFTIRICIATLDEYLYLWDEQYHALVAKNMIENPFKPMLYKNPVLPYSYQNWINNHIWLHKQPLFLWQMALSMKILGVNVFAVRLPSIILSTLIVLLIFRIGTLSINDRVGYYSALLFALSYFVLEITAGFISTDHNDVSFLFYITASIWAFLEYERTKKRIFILLIGLFAGFAVLVKWLIGFIVFPGWFLSIIMISDSRKNFSNYLNLFFAFIISMLIVLPWQIYILSFFPDESIYEYSQSSRHMFHVIEGHAGNFWLHFKNMKKLYGLKYTYIIIFLIFMIFFVKNNVFRIVFIFSITFVYLFFSIALTKMIAYTFCVSSIVFLSMGNAVDLIINLLTGFSHFLYNYRLRFTLISIILITISFFNINISEIKKNHFFLKTDHSNYYYHRNNQINLIKNLSDIHNLNNNYIVFNCHIYEEIQVMFFNNILAAYSIIPDYNIYRLLVSKGYKIAVFDHGNLPTYLLNDNDVLKI